MRISNLFVQEFIICIEMFLIAIAHMYAFGYKSYRSNDLNCTDFIPCWDCCCFCCRYDDINDRKEALRLDLIVTITGAAPAVRN